MRDFSITSMNRIYKDADAVLVLDPDLQALQSDATTAEVMIKLLLSGWSGRLWTFQEGAIGGPTYLVGSEHLWDFQDLRSQMNLQWANLFQDEPLQYFFNHALYSRLLRTIILSTGEIAKRPHRSLQRMIAGVSDRSTSRENDEAVVIGSFAGIDVSPILSIKDPQERMVTLMTLLPFIPSNILFAWGPRVYLGKSMLGATWSWVPRTLLAPYGVNNLIVDDDIALNPSQPDDLMARPLSYIHPAPEYGLATFFPGIRIPRPVVETAMPFTVLLPSGQRFQVFDEANGSRRPWRFDDFHTTMTDSALILLDLTEHMFDPALLVRITDEKCTSSSPERSFLFAESRRLMMIHAVPRTENIVQAPGLETFRGEYIRPTWWLVDPY